jgi:hypothetical protein
MVQKTQPALAGRGHRISEVVVEMVAVEVVAVEVVVVEVVVVEVMAVLPDVPFGNRRLMSNPFNTSAAGDGTSKNQRISIALDPPCSTRHLSSFRRPRRSIRRTFLR